MLCTACWVAPLSSGVVLPSGHDAFLLLNGEVAIERLTGPAGVVGDMALSDWRNSSGWRHGWLVAAEDRAVVIRMEVDNGRRQPVSGALMVSAPRGCTFFSSLSS